MSTIKVDTIATRTGSGNITASNTIAGTSATLSGTLGVTGDATFDTNTLKVDAANNRVAIGHTSPGTKVDIRDSGYVGLGVGSTNAGGQLNFIYATIVIYNIIVYRLLINSLCRHS